MTGEAWDQTLALNARSQALVLAAVLRVMLDQAPDDRGQRGAAVLVTSVLATEPVPDLFETHAYAAVEGRDQRARPRDGGRVLPGTASGSTAWRPP